MREDAKAIDVGAFEGNRLTGDEARYVRNQRMADDLPNLMRSAIRQSVGSRAAFRAMDRVRHPDFAEKLTRIPTLMIARRQPTGSYRRLPWSGSP